MKRTSVSYEKPYQVINTNYPLENLPLLAEKNYNLFGFRSDANYYYYTLTLINIMTDGIS